MSTVSNRLALGAVIVVVSLGLAACGSNSPAADPGGVAALGDTGETTTGAADGTAASDPSEAPTDPTEAFVLYDRCMADHGFPTDAAGSAGNGPTTVSGGPISVSGGDSSGSSGAQGRAVGPGGVEIPPDQIEAFQAADQACRVHLANVVQGQELTPEQQAAMADANLKMQQCMNDKGFDVQLNVSAAGTGGGITTHSETGDSSPANTTPLDPAALEAAMKECSKVFDDYPELADIPVPGRD